jgi:5'-nucleotidase
VKGKEVSGPWVLLTNDDGVDSPALVPLLRELSAIVAVRAVVPATECSWTAKIMSRFERLEVEEVDREGFAVWAVSGYPADCANLGMHTLFAEPPVLVVSGVNMGTNAGLAFLLSSGTVGAAIEGMLGGLPAAAFSVQLEGEDYARWRRHRELTPAVAELLDNTAVVTREVVAELLAGGLPHQASLLTVNMPPSTRPETPRRLTGVTATGYGSYFTTDGEGAYRYRFSGLQVREENARGDIAALERGEVAITPLRFAFEVPPTAEDCQRFERGI